MQGVDVGPFSNSGGGCRIALLCICHKKEQGADVVVKPDPGVLPLKKSDELFAQAVLYHDVTALEVTGTFSWVARTSALEQHQWLAILWKSSPSHLPGSPSP